jgi:peptidoglycan hydrolase-like protein with peptidoglycan-binding domain
VSIPLTMAWTPFLAWRPIAAAILITLALPMGAASAYPKPKVAALQVALKALHHYGGSVDGIRGPKTIAATKRFQRRRQLAADGVVGPKTRRALGKRGRPKLGSRVMKRGQRGWDVAGLQFMLRKRGFSPGSIDGGFGPATLASVKRFQAARNLTVDGLVGRATLSAVRRKAKRRGSSQSGSTGTPSGPVRFLRPVPGPMGDGFGYPPGRGGRRHDGIDFPVAYGTPVGAAGVGTVSFAGWNSGGYGNLLVIQHRLGFQTWYAHLASFSVRSGQRVAGGVKVASVGSTGRSTGPHLHFEVRHNGVPVNPLPYLLNSTSLGKLLFAPPSAPGDCTGAGPAHALPPKRQSPATAVLPDC